MNQDADLLPCPFCQSDDVEVHYEGSGDYSVMCGNCLSCGPFAFDNRAAIAAWNNRTPAIIAATKGE